MLLDDVISVLVGARASFEGDAARFGVEEEEEEEEKVGCCVGFVMADDLMSFPCANSPRSTLPEAWKVYSPTP